MEEWEAEHAYNPQKYQMGDGTPSLLKLGLAVKGLCSNLGEVIFHQQVQALRLFSLMPTSVASPTTAVVVPPLKPSYPLTLTPFSSSKTYTWGQWREPGGLWILVSISWTCSPQPWVKSICRNDPGLEMSLVTVTPGNSDNAIISPSCVLSFIYSLYPKLELQIWILTQPSLKIVSRIKKWDLYWAWVPYLITCLLV